MFKSKRRELVFPQSEHAKLAGHLACLWGNENFHPPQSVGGSGVTFESFCSGVALHDAGYGAIDLDSIGEMSEVARRHRYDQLMNFKLDDRHAEIVVKLHLLRLLKVAGYADLESRCRKQLEELYYQCGVPIEVFERLDTITNLCDSIAFDFCFEAPATNKIDVTTCITSSHNATIRYQLDGEGSIKLSPWPFPTAQISGYLLAYKILSYPDVLTPVVVPYSATPLT